jgi:hypothetical protein
MSPKKDETIYRLIARQRRELMAEIRESDVDPRRKADLEMRINYLTRLRQRYDEPLSHFVDQVVFISYSRRTGLKEYEIAREIAEQQFGFEVITGFDAREDENVLRVVREGIARAAVFLSIMTPEFEIGRSAEGGGHVWAPGVWLVEEKGMALALDKPARLLVHQDVHPDYWRATTPEKLHTSFHSAQFTPKVTEALRALMARYEELIIGRL